jgi:5-formyltetrahydrofolate cyclo-ligase
MNNSERASLRMELRRKRHALSSSEQYKAAERLYHQIAIQPFFLRAKRIGFYFASDGEIDPLAVLFKAMDMGKQCFLPLLSAHQPGKVCFAPFREGDTLQPNQWGILEPVVEVRQLVSTRSINLVFAPLVGFDEHCNRLGMGKGFYDRTFSYKSRTGCNKPKLVGLAHECQKIDQIPTDSWDVRLDGVISDLIAFSP